ncbi:MAG: hypothetical protein ABI895_00275 [Deltaproteobacteria bacterium]
MSQWIVDTTTLPPVPTSSVVGEVETPYRPGRPGLPASALV